ncbi:MAG: methylmalonyl-CoA epimerase [Halanaeroarchaeum sp.]
MRLHHAGIATDDLDSLAGLYVDLLDSRLVHEETLDDLRVAFLECGTATLELLEPQDGGTIARYLEERGPGIHHLAFETADVSEALDRARDLGIDLVDEEPRPGARGHDVAFLHPESTGGVLIEFVET